MAVVRHDDQLNAFVSAGLFPPAKDFGKGFVGIASRVLRAGAVDAEDMGGVVGFADPEYRDLTEAAGKFTFEKEVDRQACSVVVRIGERDPFSYALISA